MKKFTDKELKEAAQQVVERMGLPLSTAINSFMRQIVREGEITFSVSYRPNRATREAIREGIEEYRAGNVKMFQTTEEFFKDLKI